MEVDGSNLPGVLSYLFGIGELEAYCELVREVFPDIQKITTRGIAEDLLEIWLWKNKERSDFAVQLSESGRGIAPVLAILYVLKKYREPCRIIVDEPQAFLHPDALRRLLKVFRKYEQHQFILATHSPQVVTAAGVKQCLLVQQVNGESKIESVDASSVAGARQLLDEVGASIQDVFGAESVIWAEGPTEVSCFKSMIYRDSSLLSHGAEILPVRSTDELRGRSASRIADLYRRMCQSSSPILPPKVSFQFDREHATEQQIAEYRKNGLPFFFTQRRMYENYLLHCGAILSVATRICEGDEPPTRERVQGLIESERGAMDHSKWLVKADGARILKKIFRELFDGRHEYNKVRHGQMLTEWLLDNSPEELADLRALLDRILERHRSQP